MRRGRIKVMGYILLFWTVLFVGVVCWMGVNRPFSTWSSKGHLHWKKSCWRSEIMLWDVG